LRLGWQCSALDQLSNLGRFLSRALDEIRFYGAISIQVMRRMKALASSA